MTPFLPSSRVKVRSNHSEPIPTHNQIISPKRQRVRRRKNRFPWRNARPTTINLRTISQTSRYPHPTERHKLTTSSCRGMEYLWSRPKTCRVGYLAARRISAGRRSSRMDRNRGFRIRCEQNYKHVKAVEEALSPLGLPKECVRSAVVFVGEADLKTPVPRNVTVGAGLARYIKSFTDPVLSERQVQAVCEEISSERLTPSWSTHREHVRTLQSRKNPAAARKCPRCGKDMLLRTARRGDSAGRQFWGCSGYPSCRAVQDVGAP